MYSYLKFYKTYPEIVDSVSPQLQTLVKKGTYRIKFACLIPKPIINAAGKVETLSPLLQTDTIQMLRYLSFPHITELP